ncbi:MAG: hypothetical protein EU533_01985 [Promethearchaeota archaeon]|nr:MAG: hypothetical protein EU533_01985 [Candidatus Lokiarchaeota archaeon]
MEKREILIPIVKSPAKDAHLREGSGFSLPEIKSADYDLQTIKTLNIKIDYHRRSVHEKNVDLLKALKISDKKGKKREPFVAKEKKRTGYKPKSKTIEKKVASKREKEIVEPKKKEKVAKPKREKAPKKTVKEEEPALQEGISLTELQGLGPATAKKFNEIGVTSVENLINESPEELALLIKGCSEDRLKKWIDEAKDLISK